MKLWLPLILVACVVAGCSSFYVPEPGPRYSPANVHSVPALPKTVRRVALLPLAYVESSSALSSSADSIMAVVETELRKTGRFDVFAISREQLAAWTGQPTWRIDDSLPQNFFEALRREAACDAVLFPKLTTLHPYPPMVIGFDLRLVTMDGQHFLWAVDEIIDSGSAPVARAARDFARERLALRSGDEGALLHSPTRYSQFAAATLFNTLPVRDFTLKTNQNSTLTKEKQP